MATIPLCPPKRATLGPVRLADIVPVGALLCAKQSLLGPGCPAERIAKKVARCRLFVEKRTCIPQRVLLGSILM